MTTQHTAGPWEPNLYRVFSQSKRIAEVETSACTHEETISNARLIAAAPELLAALRGLLQHFHGPQCLAADYPGSFYMAEVEAAEDAIKAATGGTPE